MKKLIDLSRAISVADYAAQKNVTRQAVYKWIAAHEVKTIKIGKTMFIYMD